ncbi:MAG: hypothetical protein ACLTTJ_14315 [Blautia sp.]
MASDTIADCGLHSSKSLMSHGVDSLNVAAASAVAFWELEGNNKSFRNCSVPSQSRVKCIPNHLR